MQHGENNSSLSVEPPLLRQPLRLFTPSSSRPRRLQFHIPHTQIPPAYHLPAQSFPKKQYNSRITIKSLQTKDLPINQHTLRRDQQCLPSSSERKTSMHPPPPISSSSRHQLMEIPKAISRVWSIIARFCNRSCRMGSFFSTPFRSLSEAWTNDFCYN